MRLPLCLLAAGFAAGVASAQPAEIHCKHFFYGYPTGTPATNDLVIRDAYALSSNDATRFADWVAYRLTVREVGGVAEASDFERLWRMDPWLSEDETLDPSPTLSDPYRASEYDRGHMAPLAAFVGTDYVPEVNLYSNITPQRHALNAGPWEEIEAAERALVLRRAARALRTRPSGHRGFPQPDDLAAVWVMAGTLYEHPMPPLITQIPHVIPSGYWKVVAVQDGWAPGSVQVAAFLFDQDDPAATEPLDRLFSVDEVEQRTGLDLLRLLPDGVEEQVEGTVDRARAEALLFPDA